MTSKGQVRLKKVWAMLDKCAPGYTVRKKTHNWAIRYGPKAHWLPLGPHGKRQNPDIEIGHIKQLVRQLEIQECAEGELEQLR